MDRRSSRSVKRPPQAMLSTAPSRRFSAAAGKRLEGAVINIACGGRFTLRELLRSLADILGVEPVHESRPPRAGDVQHSQADITRARALIGYDVITDLHRGLKETLSALDTARA